MTVPQSFPNMLTHLNWCVKYTKTTLKKPSPALEEATKMKGEQTLIMTAPSKFHCKSPAVVLI